MTLIWTALDAVQQFLRAASDRLRVKELEVVGWELERPFYRVLGKGRFIAQKLYNSQQQLPWSGPDNRTLYGRSAMATTRYHFTNHLRGIRWGFQIRGAEYWTKLHQTQHNIWGGFQSQVTTSSCKTIIKNLNLKNQNYNYDNVKKEATWYTTRQK